MELKIIFFSSASKRTSWRTAPSVASTSPSPRRATRATTLAAWGAHKPQSWFMFQTVRSGRCLTTRVAIQPNKTNMITFVTKAQTALAENFGLSSFPVFQVFGLLTAKTRPKENRNFRMSETFAKLTKNIPENAYQKYQKTIKVRNPCLKRRPKILRKFQSETRKFRRRVHDGRCVFIEQNFCQNTKSHLSWLLG